VQTPKLRVIRQTSFTATPWKNGGGITHEAIREPEGGDPFRWRVSVAHIDASGPFSEFAGYNRKMVLLRGAGIDLHFGDGTHKALRAVGEIVEFDGALAAHCDLLSGPCVDLNLMVSKPDGAAVRVERFMESVSLHASRNEVVLVFPIDHRVTLTIDTGRTETLEPWDLAVLSQCSGHLSRLGSAHSSASTSVFLATLVFVGGQQQAGFGVGDSIDGANAP
jgi:environmental stress-induced protein Ves